MSSLKTHTQEWRQLSWRFSLRRNMTLRFTSFSIKDILAGQTRTGSQRAPQPAAGSLCVGSNTRSCLLGDFEQESPDILRGSSEDTNPLLNAKGEQRIRRVVVVSFFYMLPIRLFLSLQLYFSEKKVARLDRNIIYTIIHTC